MKHLTLIALLASCLVSACSARPTPTVASAPPPPPPPATAAWKPAIRWDDYDRGGAAWRGGSYVHAVSVPVPYESVPPRQLPGPASLAPPIRLTPSSASAAPTKAGIAVSVLPPPGNDTPLTVLSLARQLSAAQPRSGADQPTPPAGRAEHTPATNVAWARFCAGGKTLTSDDWTSIASQGGPSAVPVNFKSFCRPPSGL